MSPWIKFGASAQNIVSCKRAGAVAAVELCFLVELISWDHRLIILIGYRSALSEPFRAGSLNTP